MSSQAFRLGGRPIPLLKGAVGAAVALAALGLSPGEAQAACAPGTAATLCRVTVGGLQYDVTRFTASYNANPTTFNTTNNGGVMPWWGNGATATQFATQVGNYFGNQRFGGLGSVYFAYSRNPSTSLVSFSLQYEGSIYGDWTTADTDVRDWAQATLYSPAAASAAPGPLPLFGAAAAFGFSRKLRKRIQGARLPIGSSQPRA